MLLHIHFHLRVIVVDDEGAVSVALTNTAWVVARLASPPGFNLHAFLQLTSAAAASVTASAVAIVTKVAKQVRSCTELPIAIVVMNIEGAVAVVACDLALEVATFAFVVGLYPVSLLERIFSSAAAAAVAVLTAGFSVAPLLR